MQGTVRVLVGFIALAAVVTGCGDDDDGGATDSASTTHDAGSGDGASAAACDALIAIDAFDVDHEAPDYPESLRPSAELWRTVAAGTEGEVATGAAAVAVAIEEAVESGDVTALEEGTPEIDEADRAAHRFAYDDCDMATVDIIAEDFAFADVPDSIDAGQVAVQMQNNGEEPHVMALLRVNDDVDESVEEILGGEFEEIFAKVQTVASGGFADPGGAGIMVAEVEPGRHILLCPVPAESDGAPHFAHGMAVELTVA